MLTSVPHSAPLHPAPIGSATSPARGRVLRRADDIDADLRRLVDSAEPAVVFSSQVRLCVPTFSDACWVDIVEGGRVRYGVSFPPLIVGPTSALPSAERRVVTAFESDLAGWTGYTGVMTCLWHSRPSTTEDEDRAAEIVDHALRMIRRERLASPFRPSQCASASTRSRWVQTRSS
jgi:hypothetical protein